MNKFQILVNEFKVEPTANDMVSIISINDSLGMEITATTEWDTLLELFNTIGEELIKQGILTK